MGEVTSSQPRYTTSADNVNQLMLIYEHHIAIWTAEVGNMGHFAA